ncbi:dextranase [Prevotella sp. kh1p2]|nr:dextranase [Prevotella sp. kh1p2]SNU10283.1 dextranase [Prevotellaceae bacterium KH2P17]
MKMNSILMLLPLFALSCSDNDEIQNPGTGIPTEVVAPAITTTAELSVALSTDKALYSPGETVSFHADGTLPAGAKVRYRQGSEVVAEEPLSGADWTWKAPAADFTGYLVDVYTTSGTAETIYGTIAVDVSSSWSRFPRYGFVATYNADKTADKIASEMAFLNRCHINGIQFYDWHDKHHQPYGGEEYKDIANRQVLSGVVRNYISAQHAYGMKSMFYNLCYGALEDAQQDGVSDKWFMYKDAAHATIDNLPLSDSWKSDIFLLDPGNKDWQSYLEGKNDAVYANYDFDGFHIDQVGSRGTVYDYYGSQLNLPLGFASFINAMKEHNPDKHLVMNAVSRFGQEQIAGTGNMDFLYNEMWGSEDKFSDLEKVLRENSAFSAGKLNTVFAAYMNYNRSSAGGNFNTPGVLLTDAVMFALGGAHLELGDHMLCHEYFPNDNLKMTAGLQQALVTYYDFLTAYQNLLRDGGQPAAAQVYSGNPEVLINAWPPRLQSVATYARSFENRQVVSLLNFRQANSLSWRDLDGTMPEPQAVANLPMRIKAQGVKKVWTATPDALGGAPQELRFTEHDGYIDITLPMLKYWTMIVIEK